MPTAEEIIARRARRRARLRRRRIVAAVVAAAVVAVLAASASLALQRMGDRGSAPPAVATTPSATSSAKPSPSHSANPTASASPSAAVTPSPSRTAAAAYTVGGPAPRPAITRDYITFNAPRRAEMGAYSLAHYGSSDIHLDPKVIVVHYTCGSAYASAHATFESDAPNMGVKPGVVSQFVIDKDGTIYQQIPLAYEGRHTVGLNNVAYGIECVQECPSGDALAVSQIMHRKPQLKSLVALIRWLMYRDHITLSNVIGHGMANASPYYKDLKGWKNDHTDWSRPQVELLRAKVTGPR